MVANKLNAIMEIIGYLQKDMKVDMKGKGSYNAVSERKVLQMVRPLFVEHKLTIFPIEITHFERTGTITALGMRYKVVDIEDGDSEIMASIGQGFSSGDKGANSAMTYAMKNLILKMLLLESGDDPEAVGDVVHEETTQKNDDKVAVLLQEVALLSQGGKIESAQATQMIAYINKFSHDPGVLQEIYNQLEVIKKQ